MKNSASTNRVDAKVLREVAAFIAAGRNTCEVRFASIKYNGVCDTLSCAGVSYSFERHDLRAKFQELFVDGEGYRMIQDVMPEPEAQKVRTLALCFMAAMVEAGDA